ncbi:hypothetical protein D9615_001742 [Tricholomella constricta]|uniref:Glycosyltransferase family 8 protein n=1 Tax=Tricholomella constricta TaxID=117010 RepID=A0A8H5HP38_9AGAR|nr:hypothetical protein D9615_001742 [Tricholomella constricta]
MSGTGNPFHDVDLGGRQATALYDSWSQRWRPRRRKLLALTYIAIVFSLLLFLAEFSSSTKSTVRLESPGSPSSNGIYITTTTTISAPGVTETAIVYQNVAVKPEPVVFVLIIWSESSAIEGALLIKSVLLYNSSPSHVHIICDDSAQKFLEARFALVHRPLHDVRIWFYKPSWQSMLDRVEREGSIKSDHSAGLPGLMKLFIHEILPPSVKKGIYVDTDALFISDPTLLWNVFKRLKPSTAVVMSSHPDQNAPIWYHASRICSCVMLLDLEKLRALRLMDSRRYANSQPLALSPPAFQAKYGLPGGDDQGRYDNVRLGDQGYWWAIVDHRPDIFEPLSYDFEVTSCLLDGYMTGLGDDAISEKEELSRQIHIKDTPQEGKVVLPKLLHFNCLHGTPVYTEWDGWSDPANSLNIRWGASVAYHSGFKWIWLNKGDEELASTLEMLIIPNIIFADELEANLD